VSQARRLAHDVLRLVEGGARSGEVLHERGAALDERDRALATALSLGVLRHQTQLDYLIAHFSGKPASRLDSDVRLILRLGIFQLRYLERLPAHAVVNESVDLVRRAHKRSAAGFVNAVLRKVHRRAIPFPDTATELSVPEWLLTRWQARFGEEATHGIGRFFLQESRSYRRGDRVQDIGAQSIVPLLDLAPGLSFLDLCAAPGNKTAQALEYGVRAVACDRSLDRLSALDGLDCAKVVLDASAELPFVRRFDRILADAPCSGTGTIGRNPEIRWRVQPTDLARHAARQRAILRQALDVLAPQGRLVYSTCSLEREENEDVVGELVRSDSKWKVASVVQRVPGIDAGDGFFAAVITSK